MQSLHYNDAHVMGGHWPLQNFSVSGNVYTAMTHKLWSDVGVTTL